MKAIALKEYGSSDNFELNDISPLFDNNDLSKPPITILGSLSVDTVKKAHGLLENNSVQGKLIMTC